MVIIYMPHSNRARLRTNVPALPPHVTGPDTCSVPLLVFCSQPPSPPSVVFPSLANQHAIAVTIISRQHEVLMISGLLAGFIHVDIIEGENKWEGV